MDRSLLIFQLVPGGESRAHGPAGIAGRRLDPQSLVRTVTKNSAVTDAIKSYATGQAQVLSTGLAMESSGQAEHDFLGDFLNRPRQVHIALRQPGFRLSRRAAEKPVELPVGHCQTGTIIEKIDFEPKSAIVLQINQVIINSLHVLWLAV